jgi:hypothetical protein
LDALEAYKVVATTLAKQGIKLSRGNAKFSIRTIRSWCERVAAAPRSPAAREVARMISEKWQLRLKSIPREEARARVLMMLADSVCRAKAAGVNT